MSSLRALPRRVARRKQKHVALAVQPGRADEATPERVASLHQGLLELVRQRPHRRLAFGRPAVSLEVNSKSDRGGVQPVLVAVIPEWSRAGFDALLDSCWPDAVTTQIKVSSDPPSQRDRGRP